MRPQEKNSRGCSLAGKLQECWKIRECSIWRTRLCFHNLFYLPFLWRSLESLIHRSNWNSESLFEKHNNWTPHVLVCKRFICSNLVENLTNTIVLSFNIWSQVVLIEGRESIGNWLSFSGYKRKVWYSQTPNHPFDTKRVGSKFWYSIYKYDVRLFDGNSYNVNSCFQDCRFFYRVILPIDVETLVIWRRYLIM